MRKLILEEREVFCKNITFNREKHGNEKVRGVHVNFRCELTPDILNNLVHSPHESFEKILFTEKEHQKRAGFGAMSFDTVFDNYIIMLNYSLLDDEGKHAQRFEEAKIYKFAAEAVDGGLVELSFQVKINPSEEQAKWLAVGHIFETWKLEVVGPGQLDLIDDHVDDQYEENDLDPLNQGDQAA